MLENEKTTLTDVGDVCSDFVNDHPKFRIAVQTASAIAGFVGSFWLSKKIMASAVAEGIRKSK